VAPPPNTSPAPAPPPAHRDQIAVHLDVNQDCWVRATVDGTVQLEQVLQSGDRRDVKPGREVYLQVGNAAAVTWTINGQPAKELGKAGQPGTARLTSATMSKYLQ